MSELTADAVRGLAAPPTAEERERARAYLARAMAEAPRSRRLSADLAPRPMATAGVVGFGTMGRGIAQSLAGAGLRVLAHEPEDSAWDGGRRAVEASLARSVARGKLTEEDARSRLASIRRAPDLDDFADVDVVIEAVFEDMDVKTAVFRRLDRIAPERAVLATNTSSLDVNEIAAATGRPESVIGAHFFSPAHAMRLVEVVVADRTSPQALADVIGLTLRMGKTPVPVGVCDGFVGNRMLYAYRRAADRLLLEGALPAEVDAALREFGFAMGPYEVADLAGLDIGRAVRLRQAKTEGADPDPTPADALCERGFLGQKTGRGFYRYEPGSRKPLPHPEADALVKAASESAGITRRAVPAEEIRERCLTALAAEGRRIVSEGIAERESDVDVIWVLGYGFPPDRAGPLYWSPHHS